MGRPISLAEPWAELARRLDIIRDDMAETTLLNESLGAPSPRALDRLMAGIDAEPRKLGLLASARGGFMTWLGTLLASQPPRRELGRWASISAACHSAFGALLSPKIGSRSVAMSAP